ncbi:kinase-like domain-containing protein [Suillus paluster]|uniref:kinase-like domain-containing protein n=1 Tax=Suillus paluster TaxID=48578 RepID=UPI001B85FB9D|nr:kinase-like domain-containing protein [Suillus paluster]KAG1730390.1 kinase-like domain-containing protein [Suillus paluster]
MAPKYPKIEGYELVQQIGGGGFSSVFRAVNIESHQVAACKLVLIREQTTQAERKLIDKEMKVHARLKHKHVLEFLHAAVVEPKFKQHYVPGIYMLLELAAGGDLFDKIAPDVGLGEDVANYYFLQLLEGMDFIHREGVCHRDLKPENLLLDVAGTLKITDFGLASVYKLKETGKTKAIRRIVRQLPVHYGTPYEAEPIDAWGIGVILFTLLAGNFCKYISGEIFNEAPWNRLGEKALSLICGLLTVEPEKRMTLPEVFNDPWCTRPNHLTESLRANGDMNYAMPDITSSAGTRKDADGDEIMHSATHQSQFTQSLLLFSQTQSGRRYTPNLTRFYTSLGPGIMMQLIKESLSALGVKHKDGPTGEDEGGEVLRLRVGGYDKRRITFKGWVELENFRYAETDGSFCLMTRDVGNPISWRQLWKALIQSPAVDPHVLRR